MENRVRELRAERGWSQADLAMRLGVSGQTVNAGETAKYNHSLPLAVRAADRGDLPAGWRDGDLRLHWDGSGRTAA